MGSAKIIRFYNTRSDLSDEREAVTPIGLALPEKQKVYVREDLPGCVKQFLVRTFCQMFFGPGIKLTFKRRERREICDNVTERAEKISSVMKQSGQVIREFAWRVAVESRGYIKPQINTKVSLNFSPFLAHV